MAWHGMPPGVPSTPRDGGPGPGVDGTTSGCSCQLNAHDSSDTLFVLLIILAALGISRRPLFRIP
ncbi:MAG: hypothetical protein V1754_02300 [Pseudomonadota bacterium]